MGRNENKSFFCDKRVKAGHCDCSTFLRVCSAPEFVKKDKGIFVSVLYGGRYVFHVGRES